MALEEADNLLKVGIAGYGVVGKRRREVVEAHPSLETTVVCDRYFGASGVMDDGVVYHSHYKNLLEKDLDVLFVCLTNDLAAEVTIAGLERGLHVFCEKPPGRDLIDIASVRACEARHAGLKLQYGFNHRYHHSVREALTLVASGELGRILNLRGIYGKSKIIGFDSNWRTQRAIAGGGILLDQGIHMVDLMRLFAGDFAQVYSFISNDYWHHDVEDNAYALMRTEEGVVAFLHSSATQWRHRFQLEITLENGGIILAGILSGSKSYGAETMTIIHKGAEDGGDPSETRHLYNEDPSWRDEVADFARAIINDRPIVEGSSLEAMKTMELVYRIYCADPEWRKKYKLNDRIIQVAQ